MKKTYLKILLILILLITFVASVSSAANNTTASLSPSSVTMTVVEEPVATIQFGSKSYAERRVISKDLTNKEITFQLKVTNEEEGIKPNGEIMLVLDNSLSMESSVGGVYTRKDLIINSAQTLIRNLLADNDQLKIGAVSFSTNEDVSKQGTIEDAQLISELTNNYDNLNNAITNIQYTGAQTDLDAGITLAKQYFSNETDKSHKYIIVLTDGVPNVAINYDGIYYSDDSIAKSKASLQSLSSVTDNVIVMLTGIEDGDKTVHSFTETTYNQVVEGVFGTTENPTIGKFYYVTDDKVEKTIVTDIYNDLLPTYKTLKNIVLSDYFSQEIVDNFVFSYVSAPNIGTISETIDKTNNSITWNIPELKSNETAIVQYKIKLKEGFSSDILDKIIDTHTKLDLTYTNDSNEPETKTSDVVPKIKLVKPATPTPTPTSTPKVTPTPTEVLPKIIPYAGKATGFIFITIISAISIIVGIRYKNLNKIIK